MYYCDLPDWGQRSLEASFRVAWAELNLFWQSQALPIFSSSVRDLRDDVLLGATGPSGVVFRLCLAPQGQAYNPEHVPLWHVLWWWCLLSLSLSFSLSPPPCLSFALKCCYFIGRLESPLPISTFQLPPSFSQFNQFTYPCKFSTGVRSRTAWISTCSSPVPTFATALVNSSNTHQMLP